MQISLCTHSSSWTGCRFECCCKMHGLTISPCTSQLSVQPEQGFTLHPVMPWACGLADVDASMTYDAASDAQPGRARVRSSLTMSHCMPPADSTTYCRVSLLTQLVKRVVAFQVYYTV